MNSHSSRALIMAHYDPDGLVDPYVIYALQAYRPLFDHITVVSVSVGDLPRDAKTLADTFIRRDNVGYDFSSWKAGFESLADKEKFSEIVFVNDSIYGPLFDIGQTLRSDKIKNADFWGPVASFQRRWHIQSFLFAMRRSLLTSGAAHEFWNQVQPLEQKEDVIDRYELAMAAYFRERGFRVDTIYAENVKRSTWKILRDEMRLKKPDILARHAYYNWRWKSQNPMHLFWRPVIEAGIPFIKTEIFRRNPLYLPLDSIKDYIVQNTRYPFELISAHAHRTASHPL